MTNENKTNAIAKEFGSRVVNGVIVMRCVNRNFGKRIAKVRAFADSIGCDIETFAYATNKIGVEVEA
jgi:hypothetical protein